LEDVNSFQTLRCHPLSQQFQLHVLTNPGTVSPHLLLLLPSLPCSIIKTIRLWRVSSTRLLRPRDPHSQERLETAVCGIWGRQKWPKSFAHEACSLYTPSSMGMRKRWAPTASTLGGFHQRGDYSTDRLRRFLGSDILLCSAFLFVDLIAENFADLDRRCPRPS